MEIVFQVMEIAMRQNLRFNSLHKIENPWSEKKPVNKRVLKRLEPHFQQWI